LAATPCSASSASTSPSGILRSTAAREDLQRKLIGASGRHDGQCNAKAVRPSRYTSLAVLVSLWRFWRAWFYLLVEHLREGKQDVNVGCGDRYLFGFVVFRTFDGFG
jgi:hypothetical protein